MKLTLGIDSSTQGVKAVAWDVEAQKVVFSASVNYGKDLPQYGSPDGFLPNDDALVRHADPRAVVLRSLRDVSEVVARIVRRIA